MGTNDEREGVRSETSRTETRLHKIILMWVIPNAIFAGSLLAGIIFDIPGLINVPVALGWLMVIALGWTLIPEVFEKVGAGMYETRTVPSNVEFITSATIGLLFAWTGNIFLAVMWWLGYFVMQWGQSEYFRLKMKRLQEGVENV